jgi:hypothetical protein
VRRGSNYWVNNYDRAPKIIFLRRTIKIHPYWRMEKSDMMMMLRRWSGEGDGNQPGGDNRRAWRGEVGTTGMTKEKATHGR